nr:hypothetical protein [Tanacetum cinerariifolium]
MHIHSIVASSTSIFTSKSLQFEHPAFLEGPEESLGGVEGLTKEVSLVETPT